MDFTRLPAELRLSIAECLDPHSAFRLSLTCREQHDLLASLMQFYKRYWIINTKDAGRLIWYVTQEAIGNPKIAQCIEEISLPTERQILWHDENGYFDELTVESENVVPESLVDLYLAEIKRHPILSEMLEDYRHGEGHGLGMDWTLEQAIRIGLDIPVATLLAAMASNLRTLRFTQMHYLEDEFADFVRLVSIAYRDETQHHLLPFQRLAKVAIAYHDTEGSCSADWSIRFMNIPTVETLVAYKMGGTLGDPDEASLGKSNVKHLYFNYCYFDQITLQAIIASTKDLRTFTYDIGGPTINEEGNFEMRATVQGLLDVASHSLEEIHIADEGDHAVSELYRCSNVLIHNNLQGDVAERIDIVSLRGFQNLKKLRCPWILFIKDSEFDDMPLPDGEFHAPGPEEDGLVNFAEMLPRSLEALHIDQGSQHGDQLQSLLTMIANRDTDLPNLRQIFLEDFPAGDGKKEIRRALKEKGIAYRKLPEIHENPLVVLLDDQGAC